MMKYKKDLKQPTEKRIYNVKDYVVYPKHGVGKIISSDEIELRVYERGAGETLACGSGACAAALIAIQDKTVETPVKVNFEKGSIFIDYNIENKQITARGKAEFIKEISVTIQ